MHSDTLGTLIEHCVRVGACARVCAHFEKQDVVSSAFSARSFFFFSNFFFFPLYHFPGDRVSEFATLQCGHAPVAAVRQRVTFTSYQTGNSICFAGATTS